MRYSFIVTHFHLTSRETRERTGLIERTRKKTVLQFHPRTSRRKKCETVIGVTTSSDDTVTLH